MNNEEKFKTYDRIMAVLVALMIVAMLLTSCATTKRNGYQDHLRTTHTNNWVNRDNGGCGWSN